MADLINVHIQAENNYSEDLEVRSEHLDSGTISEHFPKNIQSGGEKGSFTVWIYSNYRCTTLSYSYK